MLRRQRELAEQLRLAKKQFTVVVSKLADRWDAAFADRQMNEITKYSNAIGIYIVLLNIFSQFLFVSVFNLPFKNPEVLRQRRVKGGVAHQKELSVQEVLMARKAEYLLHQRASEEEASVRQRERPLNLDAAKRAVNASVPRAASAVWGNAMPAPASSSATSPMTSEAALNSFVSGVSSEEVQNRRLLLEAIKQQTQEAVNAALAQRGLAAGTNPQPNLYFNPQPLPPQFIPNPVHYGQQAPPPTAYYNPNQTTTGDSSLFQASMSQHHTTSESNACGCFPTRRTFLDFFFCGLCSHG